MSPGYAWPLAAPLVAAAVETLALPSHAPFEAADYALPLRAEFP
jgi:hypothetical protein